MLLFRKILFYVFVLVYIIGCPLIVLNSLGIVFFPDQKKLIQSTGLISLATIPEGASLFINNKLYNRKSPTLIRNLREGQYSIKIALDQYAEAEQLVQIDKGQAIALEDIILIPKKWPKDILAPFMIEKIFTIYNNPYLVLSKNMMLSGIYIFRREDSIFSNLENGIKYPQKEVILPLFSNDSQSNNMLVSEVILMPKSFFALVVAKQGDKNYYLWTDLRVPGGPVLDLSQLFVGVVDKICWNSEDNESIFYLSENSLNRINIKENAVYPNIADNIKGFGIINKKILVVNGANQFEEIDYKNNTKKSLIGQWSLLPDVFQKALSLKMQILSEKIVLFIDDHGSLLSTTLPYELIPAKVIGLGDILDDNKVLVWTKTKLGYIDFKEIKHEGIFEAGPRVEWVVKNAKDMQQAFWVNNGSHILFRDGNQIKLVQMESYARDSIFNVGYATDTIAYFDNLGKAFLKDRDTNKFISLTVVPKHGLIKFVLPESINKQKN
ncbi:MAG: PEGA domain-containing protein [Candidatus Omnitrophota bacterium]